MTDIYFSNLKMQRYLSIDEKISSAFGFLIECFLNRFPTHLKKIHLKNAELIFSMSLTQTKKALTNLICQRFFIPNF